MRRCSQGYSKKVVSNMRQRIHLVIKKHEMCLLTGILACCFMSQASGEMVVNDSTGRNLMGESPFFVSIVNSERGGYALSMAIQEEHYIYGDRFSVVELTGRGISIESIDIQNIAGSQYGDLWNGYVNVSIKREPPVDDSDLSIEVAYQGCWRGLICYPPEKVIFNVD